MQRPLELEAGFWVQLKAVQPPSEVETWPPLRHAPRRRPHQCGAAGWRLPPGCTWACRRGWEDHPSLKPEPNTRAQGAEPWPGMKPSRLHAPRRVALISPIRGHNSSAGMSFDPSPIRRCHEPSAYCGGAHRDWRRVVPESQPPQEVGEIKYGCGWLPEKNPGSRSAAPSPKPETPETLYRECVGTISLILGCRVIRSLWCGPA